MGKAMIRLTTTAARMLPDNARVRLFQSEIAPILRRVLNHLQPVNHRLSVVPLTAPLDGHQMLLDWHTQKAFAFGLYERFVVAAMCRMVQPGWTVADVGAHIGYHALLLRKLVGPGGKVVAFEPIQRNFEVLRRNLALNGYLDVHAENCAVAECSGTKSMERRNDDPLSSVSALAKDGQIEVRSVALDDYFVPGLPVMFVKIDVEGAELGVLEGMTRILQGYRPVLIVAVHGNRDEHRVPRYLTELGYQSQLLGAWGAEHHLLVTPR